MSLSLGTLKSKYKDLSSAAKASVWYAVCGILQKAIGVVVVPLYTRIMDSTAYGTYTVFQSWYTMLFVFTSLGLANYVFNNGMLKYKEDRDGFSSAMLGLSGVSTLIFTASFLLFPSFWTEALGLSAPLVFLIFVRCLISPSYEFWAERLRYEFRYKGVVALTLVLTLAVPVVSVPVILLADDKAATALVCQVVVMSLVYAIPLFSILRKSRKLFNKEYWVYALRFNLPLIPSMFATLALQQLNRVIISGTVGESQAAIYSVAFSVGSVTMFIYSALEQSYRPWFYQGMGTKGFRSTSIGVLLIALVGGSCWLITLFSPEVMRLFAPEEYQGGVYAIAPIASSTVLIMLYSILITVEYYFEETVPIPIVSILIAIFNYVVSSWLVPIFGYIAASYVTLACYTLLVLGHLYLCRRAMVVHMSGDYPLSLTSLMAFTIGCVCLILITQLIFGFLWLRVGIVVAALVCLCVFHERAFGLLDPLIKTKKRF